jgi:hypothetical protein
MELATRYRIFKVVRLSGTHHDIYQHGLEGCNAEQYENENDAKAWIMEHGDFRNAQFEYVILPCFKAVKN